MEKHKYGYLKDKKDMRDFKYSVPEFKFLPPSVDLREFCSPVQNQGGLGSCTGFASADGMREMLLRKQHGRQIEMSPLYVYYHERLLEGTVLEDAGAYLRDGFKVLAKIGCARDLDWPYCEANFTNPPSLKAEKGASEFKVMSYHRLLGLRAIKSCLAEGYGCAIGFTVRKSFERIGSDGKMPNAWFWEKALGGHAVFVCGYVDDKKWRGGGYLIIKNSWGTEWGDKGFFYMPYAYVNQLNVPDAWTAR